MTIIEKTTDLAGKTRVLVRCDDGEVLSLKFQSDQSDANILTEASRIKTAMDAQRAIDALPLISFDL